MLRLVVFLAVFTGLGSVSAAGDTSAGPDTAIAVQASGQSDLNILRRLEGLLAEMRGYEHVTLEVQGGFVTLTGRVVDAQQRDMLAQMASRVEGVVGVENRVEVSFELAERVAPVADRLWRQVITAISAAPVLLVAMAAGMAVGWAGFQLAKLKAPLDRLAPNEFMADLLRQLLRLIAILAGLTLFLDIMGASAMITKVFGALGIVGLAVGFAVRDTVENFIASIMLSLRTPFRPREFVEIGGDQGFVMRLTSRATILLTPDGNHVRIPNATVFKSKITNFSRHPQRRFTFRLSVPNPGNLSGARMVLLDALQQAEFVLADPAPAVWLGEVADGAASFTCAGWLDPTVTNFNAGRGEALRICVHALEQAGKGLSSSGLTITMAQTTAPPQPDSTASPVHIAQDAALVEIIEEELEDPELEDLFAQRTKDE